jgi:hypothetical protein
MRLDELGQLKNRMTSLGFNPATFWLVATMLPHARYVNSY